LSIELKKIDLILIGQTESKIQWPYGKILLVGRNPSAVHEAVVNHIVTSSSEAVLFWGNRPLPSIDQLTNLLAQKADVWHAGLKLGMQGLPSTINKR
jgi:hypothetical protein